ncbi:MAG: hypothetical protein R3E94_11175 [Burkholderiaceae bacterium]
MSETSGSGFGKFVPGFDFLQSLAGQAADGVVQGLGKSIPQLPNLGNWVAPTFNVEDLEKRIDELKAVHFWLDQNAKALGATIQALEVQKMTLATLQTMNFSLGDVANALKLKAADTVAGFTGRPGQEPTEPEAAPATRFAGLEIPPRTYGAAEARAEPEPEPDDEPEPESAPRPVARARKARSAKAEPAASSNGMVDPMHWWGALTQQFQGIAANALKDVARQATLDTTRQVASGVTEQAVRTASGVAGKVTRQVGQAAGAGKAAARAVGRGAAKAVPARPKAKARSGGTGSRKAAAPAPVIAPTTLKAGDWPLPGGLFQVPGFLGGATAPASAPASAPAAPDKQARSRAQATSGARKTAAAKPARKTGRPAAGKAPAAKPGSRRRA